MSDVVITALGLALLGVPAVLVPTVLSIRGRAPWLVAALVVGAADVVGCSLALSVPGWLTRVGMLGAMTLVATAAAFEWHRSGRPRPRRLRRRGVAFGPLGGASWVLLIAASVALLVQLYVAMRVAPTNWDSMTYHLSRAAYWLQEHSVLHYDGGTVRQLGAGPNAEILVAWSMLMTGTDRWVELVQWISLIGLALTIFSGARMLGFLPGPATFAAALFVLLPQPIIQAATTQNDIVASFFIAAGALFVARGLRDRHLGDLAVAGAAIGLAVGTKGTALIAGPSLAIIALAAVRAWRPPRRVVLAGIGFVVAGVAILGAFNYVSNARHGKGVFGGVSDQVSGGSGSRFDNAAHDLWTFADTPGLTTTWLQEGVRRPVKAVAGGLLGADFPYAVDSGVSEDTSAYGLVGFLLLFPLLIVVLLGPRSPPARRVAAAAALAYILVFSFQIDDNIWLGRVYMPGVALAAPLFAAFARRGWFAGLAAALALLTIVPCLLQNPFKQILVPEGQQTVFALNRVQQMSQSREFEKEVVEQVQRFSSPTARIGFVGGEDSWDYPFFGAHHNHYVKRFPGPGSVGLDTLRRYHLHGIVFANVGKPPAPLDYATLANDYYWVGPREP